jgi:hypothetical protein
MPNRYLPSALCDMIEERHETLLSQAKGKSDGDDYVPEYKALLDLLSDEARNEYQKRTGDSDG